MENELEEKKSTAGAWIMFGLSVLYAISPIDIIPDVPVVGWIDDFFITATGSLNLIQSQLQGTNEWLAQIVKVVKWVVILLGVIVILLVALIGALIVKWIAG